MFIASYGHVPNVASNIENTLWLGTKRLIASQISSNTNIGSWSLAIGCLYNHHTLLPKFPASNVGSIGCIFWHQLYLRPWSSWTANSDKKLNVNKLCVTSRKTALRSFAKFSVNFQDVISFGKILKKLKANFRKILRKEKIFKNFCKF